MLGKEKKLRDLGLRVYNNKMTVREVDGNKVNEDERDIVEICNKTFGHGTPSPENLHRFNQLLVETAEVIAEPRVNQVLGLLADVDNVPAGTVKTYKIPKTAKPKFLYTAKGTGVDLVRIDGGETKKIAQPQSLTYGGYYEITSFMADPVDAFKKAVDNLANAKVEYYFERVFEVMKSAIANSEIPANNIAAGSNLTIAEYQKVEQTMIRLTGGRPLMVADLSLINHFANQVHIEQKDLLTDEIRDMLREDLIPSKISKSVAVAFPNQWIDEENSKVKFDVQQGFVFPGGTVGKKPFAITEFGTKRQYSTVDPETEQVELKIVFEADVTLLNGRYLGSVSDNSVTV